MHGDYRLDNLLLDARRRRRRGRRLADLHARSGAERRRVLHRRGPARPRTARAHEERLVRDYHRGLGAAGVTGYDWDECWADYRRGTFAGLIMAVAASMLVERTDRGDEMFLTMAARHSRHVLDLDAAELLAG